MSTDELRGTLADYLRALSVLDRYRLVSEQPHLVDALTNTIADLIRERDELRVERDTARRNLDNADALNRDALRHVAEAQAERDELRRQVAIGHPVIEAACNYASQQCSWSTFAIAVADYRATLDALAAGAATPVKPTWPYQTDGISAEYHDDPDGRWVPVDVEQDPG